MANSLFVEGGRNFFLNGSINMGTEDIRIALIDTREGGAPNVTTATSLGNINSAPASIAKLSDAGLTAKTTISGIFDAADLTMTAVSGTSSIEGIIIFSQANSSRLIGWIDTGTGIRNSPLVRRLTSKKLSNCWNTLRAFATRLMSDNAKGLGNQQRSPTTVGNVQRLGRRAVGFKRSRNGSALSECLI